MSKYEYDEVIKYLISAKTNSPLHIGGALGGKEDILMDPVLGIPFIQASSLAGMFRSASNIINDRRVTDELFGSARKQKDQDNADNRSRVRITDGRILSETVKLEIRPGVSIDPKTGTVNSKDGGGQKFDLTYISANAEFSFCIYLYVAKGDNELPNRLEALLGIMKNGEAVLGAKKSSGAGKFSATTIRRAVFDLTSEKDRKEWISESEDTVSYEDITEKCTSDKTEVKYEVEVDAVTEGPIQIKGISMTEFGKDAPDSGNIQNSNNEFIIPGTSVRGTIRSQMEKIAGYKGIEGVIEDSFGVIGKKHSDSKRGNLVFNDVVIGREEDIVKNPIRSRIHIDKFTGGVISQALFKEKNASGEVRIRIQIYDRNNPDATLGLLILALRDLALNVINLGNGYATGKGFLNVSKISVNNSHEQADIVFDENVGEIHDQSGILQNALNALKEVLR